MSAVSDLLSKSRAAHKDAKNLIAKGLGQSARALFQVALKLRLEAREADPDYADESWIEDAKSQPMRGAKGETVRGFHRVPGLTVREVAIHKDAELERYYREQLGEIVRERVKVENPEVVTPKQWIEVQAGKVDPETGKTICNQRHVFQLLAVDQRQCQVCGRVDELRETKAAEETDAFQQLQRERQG